MNNATIRRDKVDNFKKTFGIVRLALMGIVSILMSILFLWIQYSNYETARKRAAEISTAGWIKFMSNSANTLLVISYALCCFITCCFIVYLITQGIQTLVIRYMMRHSDNAK